MNAEASFADVHRSQIDGLVADIAILAALREQDDDRYGLWTFTGVGIVALGYGLASYFCLVNNLPEILLGIGVVSLVRAAIVRNRLHKRSAAFSRLRDRVADKFGNRLLWNAGQL